VVFVAYGSAVLCEGDDMRREYEIPSGSDGAGKKEITLQGFLMQVNVFKVADASASMEFEIHQVFDEFGLEEPLTNQVGETVTVDADKAPYRPFVKSEDESASGLYWLDGKIRLSVSGAGGELPVALRVIVSTSP
jgi:hypothetical protein